ncbi:MAG: hypothetical protein AB3N10_14760 [Allomuricauda sp.]
MKTLALGLSVVLLLYGVLAIASCYLFLDGKRPNIVKSNITAMIKKIFRSSNEDFSSWK